MLTTQQIITYIQSCDNYVTYLFYSSTVHVRYITQLIILHKFTEHNSRSNRQSCHAIQNTGNLQFTYVRNKLICMHSIIYHRMLTSAFHLLMTTNYMTTSHTYVNTYTLFTLHHNVAQYSTRSTVFKFNVNIDQLTRNI